MKNEREDEIVEPVSGTVRRSRAKEKEKNR